MTNPELEYEVAGGYYRIRNYERSGDGSLIRLKWGTVIISAENRRKRWLFSMRE